MSQLKTYYEKEVVPKLFETFKYSNMMQVPKLDKVVLNMGMGEAIHNIKLLDAAVDELTTISGQKPVITRAKKSIAAFKLRAGMPIGCMVTLRKNRMYDFVNKLVNVALPRVRDFRGRDFYLWFSRAEHHVSDSADDGVCHPFLHLDGGCLADGPQSLQ